MPYHRSWDRKRAYRAADRQVCAGWTKQQTSLATEQGHVAACCTLHRLASKPITLTTMHHLTTHAAKAVARMPK